MKKLLVAGLATIISTLTLNAQNTNFGLKAGLNSSSVKVTNGDDWHSKSGLHAGGFAHVHVSSMFAIQPEIVFSMQGGKDEGEELKLNYINIPVIAQIMLADGFRLQTGPQVGFLLSAKKKTGNVELDVSDDINSLDFSWSFGASYLFPQGVGIDARYNLGINNISEDTDYEAMNRVFQIGLFYQFMKGKAATGRR